MSTSFEPPKKKHVVASEDSPGWQGKLSRYRPSTISLVLANLIPLFGVFLFGWSTFAIVALYWSENVIIGAINVFKIVFSNPRLENIQARFTPKTEEEKQLFQEQQENWPENARMLHRLKFFLVPFFMFHYGLFCLVHGVFVVALLGGDQFGRGEAPSLDAMLRLFTEEQLWWGVGALTISHLVSFFTNYLGRGEYLSAISIVLMFQPYVRIVLLHVAILIGAFATIALGSPAVIVILLIVGKTLLDLTLHLREHDKFDSLRPDALQV